MKLKTLNNWSIWCYKLINKNWSLNVKLITFRSKLKFFLIDAFKDNFKLKFENDAIRVQTTCFKFQYHQDWAYEVLWQTNYTINDIDFVGDNNAIKRHKDLMRFTQLWLRPLVCSISLILSQRSSKNSQIGELQ